MSRRITIAGRAFVLAGQTTIAHDLHTMGLVRKAGLEEQLAPKPGDDPAANARRVLSVAAATGVALDLLGALFVPEGVEPTSWTPELAGETARFFGEVSDPEDKAIVQGLIASALADFLRAALLSSMTSDEASSPADEGRPGTGTPGRKAPSGNGPPSSASSPKRTTTTPSG